MESSVSLTSEATPSRWVKAITTNGNIRAVSVEATSVARELAKMHGLRGAQARGMAEAAICGYLLGSYCKAGERINLNIRGSGFCRQALVEAHPSGTARGYLVANEFDLSGAASVERPSGPWGEGVLTVLRTKGAENQQPYIGTVPLATGHLAKDLTFYWVQSEQIPSAVGLAIQQDSSGAIEGAAGFLVQAMPGATTEEIRLIEEQLRDLPSQEGKLLYKADPREFLMQVLSSTAFMVLEERPLRIECHCSWDRVKRALVLIGEGDLRKLLEQDQNANVRCDFCTKEYQFSAVDLEDLIDAARRRSGSPEGTS